MEYRNLAFATTLFAQTAFFQGEASTFPLLERETMRILRTALDSTPRLISETTTAFLKPAAALVNRTLDQAAVLLLPYTCEFFIRPYPSLLFTHRRRIKAFPNTKLHLLIPSLIFLAFSFNLFNRSFSGSMFILIVVFTSGDISCKITGIEHTVTCG